MRRDARHAHTIPTTSWPLGDCDSSRYRTHHYQRLRGFLLHAALTTHGKPVKIPRLTRASIAALVAVTAVGLIAAQILLVDQSDGKMDCDRFSRVVLMGFAVANPDYTMKSSISSADECSPWPSLEDEIPPFDGSLQVEIGPRMTATGPSELPAMQVEFRQDPSGQIYAPRPTPWHLTEVLATFGDEDAQPGSRQTVDLVKDLDALKYSVHAIVELKRPLSEKEANEIYRSSGLDEIAFLSSGARGRPIGWPFTYPGVYGTYNAAGNPPGTSQVQEFQRWVSLLRPEDATILDGLGLDLADLQSSAAAGLVYGFTVINTPEIAAYLAKHPKVRSVRVLEIVPRD